MRPEFEKQLESAWPSHLWKDHRVLVGVSGGADSVALLRALHANCQSTNNLARPSRIVAAHFNHRWRRSESDADEVFVKQLANQLNLDFIVGTADSSSDKTEATAREQRYDFLERTAEKIGARYVATAHTANDQVETVLHRILRGTGIGGLQGIPRIRVLNPSVTVVRPILQANRTEVLSYLNSIDQEFRKDISNKDLRYTRNRIRRELLPHLRNDFNGEVDQAIRRLAQLAGEYQSVIESIVSNLFDACVTTDAGDVVTVDSSALHGQPPLVVRELFIHVWKQNNWPRQSMGMNEWAALVRLTESEHACYTAPGRIDCKSSGTMIRLKRLT